MDSNKRPTDSKDEDESPRKKVQLESDMRDVNGSADEPENGERSPLTTAEQLVAKYAPLEPLPERPVRLDRLNRNEVAELERALGLGGESGWREDWAGNLCFADEEIANPEIGGKAKNSFKQSLILWSMKIPSNQRLVHNLMRYVYHFEGTPPSAKRVLAAADPSSLESMEKAIRRCNYDPTVLSEDGWITVRSNESEGATGGPYRIGDFVRWDGEDAVIIAYLHDDDIGDLWKALWVDESRQSVDLEAEELEEAQKKYLRRLQKSSKKDVDSRRSSSRLGVNLDFTLEGIETGIVLATSFAKGVRTGVYWPARVMHASEGIVDTRRGASKHKIDVVFLAPYWDSMEIYPRAKKVEALSEATDAVSQAAPLFQFDNIDANEEMIKPYPYLRNDEIDIEQLRYAFRFTGLPKGVFGRFLDAHRLAHALSRFAAKELTTETSSSDRASAALFDKHPLAVQAPLFPAVVLQLPYAYMISKLPKHARNPKHASESDEKENIIDLKSVVRTLEPPESFGKQRDSVVGTPVKSSNGNRMTSPSAWIQTIVQKVKDTGSTKVSLEMFVEDAHALSNWFETTMSDASVFALAAKLNKFVENLSLPRETRHVSDLVRAWSYLKSNGEDIIDLVADDVDAPGILSDWRHVMERIYKYITQSTANKSIVFTDYRCNGHVTSDGCFERTVRLPAAIKAARRAGAGVDEAIHFVMGVDDEVVEHVEKNLLPHVHESQYLQRMKDRCLSAKDDEQTLVLTEDSDGVGGHDTVGTRKSWNAAVVAASAAVSCVDRIMSGSCVNAFSITRPPGHHAGRKLHSMKAISNGFCILNNVACAAIYATTHYKLKRVVVVDIDVHHGNGTQDILCSTYDPRFLYISLHAGGAQVNGVTAEDDPEHQLHDLGGKSKQGGIFPGRCGDTSPHKNVINIPLGEQVTAHDIGTALLGKVRPAIEAFAPDLILMSTGFDAHKHDPMGLGTLTAEDFGNITEMICGVANKVCSGRLLSVLEGGYSVPCCRPQRPWVDKSKKDGHQPPVCEPVAVIERTQPSKLLDLGDELPKNMDDQVPPALQKRLEKCHAEGFMECVESHLLALKRSSCSRR